MGSDSDFDIMKEAVTVLDEFSITSEISVISAHRTPRDLEALCIIRQREGTQGNHSRSRRRRAPFPA